MAKQFALDYIDVAERIVEFRTKTTVGLNGCIEWTGKVNVHGYGVVYHAGHEYVAHRVFYVADRGIVPDELCLDHLCLNKACVNPVHLEPVTWGENVRRAATKTHCIHGHSLADAYVSGGRRDCRPCKRKRSADRRAARREAA